MSGKDLYRKMRRQKRLEAKASKLATYVLSRYYKDLGLDLMAPVVRPKPLTGRYSR